MLSSGRPYLTDAIRAGGRIAPEQVTALIGVLPVRRLSGPRRGGCGDLPAGVRGAVPGAGPAALPPPLGVD
jgi:hypothetical protein